MHVSKQCSLQKRWAREANVAAHGLAQKGKRFETVKYWIEEAPMRVEELVIEDKRRMQRGGNGVIKESQDKKRS